MNSGRPGQRVRLEDVAKLAGVSMKTVSNVVHDYPHVSAKMRERVQAAIDQLGYRPNLTARRLATGRTGMLALAIPEIDQPYFAELARQIGEEAVRRGYRVIVEQTLNDVEAERAVIRDREEGLVDGVIFQPARIDTMEIARLRPDTPLVLLGEGGAAAHDRPRHDRQRRGGARGRRAAAAAGPHPDRVPRHGARRPHRVDAPAPARLPGGAARRRDPQRARRSCSRPTDSASTAAWPSLLAALDAGVRFDALICRDDLFAMAALRGLDRAGLRVPDDVAVLGWDDTALARYSTPALSSISPDKESIARTRSICSKTGWADTTASGATGSRRTRSSSGRRRRSLAGVRLQDFQRWNFWVGFRHA